MGLPSYDSKHFERRTHTTKPSRNRKIRTATVTLSLEEWKAWRRAAGLHIDPETAEISWDYQQLGDPYRVHPELAADLDSAGPTYFARSPGTSVWIEFGDLPETTRDELWRKYKKRLAFQVAFDFFDFAARDVEQNFGSITALSEEDKWNFYGLMKGIYESYVDYKMKRQEDSDVVEGQAESANS
jgi:hypothetical protein